MKKPNIMPSLLAGILFLFLYACGSSSSSGENESAYDEKRATELLDKFDDETVQLTNEEVREAVKLYSEGVNEAISEIDGKSNNSIEDAFEALNRFNEANPSILPLGYLIEQNKDKLDEASLTEFNRANAKLDQSIDKFGSWLQNTPVTKRKVNAEEEEMEELYQELPQEDDPDRIEYADPVNN